MEADSSVWDGVVCVQQPAPRTLSLAQSVADWSGRGSGTVAVRKRRRSGLVQR